jgi:ferredoxin-NADP reductase
MPVVSNVHLKLAVVNRRELGNDSMAVMFKRPIGFEYEAGDWIDLMQPGVILPGGKTYSLSSSPTESELAIMFRKGQSPLKQRLQTLQPGDELVVTQYGNDYDFRLRDNRSSVLIAGGIGIAPFRSMLKEMADTKSQNQVQLLYFNKGSDFLLPEELNQWACSLQIDIKYFDTNELKRKDRLKIFKTVMNHNAHHFFIAGPESMVESTEHLLIDDLGIDVKDIRIDRFGGY